MILERLSPYLGLLWGRYNIYIWRGSNDTLYYNAGCRRRLKANNQQSTNHSRRAMEEWRWWWECSVVIRRTSTDRLEYADYWRTWDVLLLLNNNILDYDNLQKMSLGPLSNITVGTIFRFRGSISVGPILPTMALSSL